MFGVGLEINPMSSGFISICDVPTDYQSVSIVVYWSEHPNLKSEEGLCCCDIWNDDDAFRFQVHQAKYSGRCLERLIPDQPSL